MPPYRIEWSEQAREDVRRLDRATALRIFEGVLHCARTGAGDVEPLHGPMAARSGCASRTIALCSASSMTLCASPASVIARRPTAERAATALMADAGLWAAE